MIPRHFQIFAALLLVALIASGVYMYVLKRREEASQQRVQQGEAASLGVGGTATSVKLTIAYEDDGVFAAREKELLLPDDANARARELLRGLLEEYEQSPSPHPLDAAGGVNTVFLLADGTCIVDLNAAFSQKHRSGIQVEFFTVASMVQTLADNLPEVRRVKFIVDGRERATLAGHADLSSLYEVAAVREAVRAAGPGTARR